MFIVDSLTIT